MFISFSVVPPNPLSSAMENTETNIVGHGSALILRAVYMELAVIIQDPSTPISSPLKDN
jgi:hypothetical protein